jgi:hypothetical protein
MEKSIEGNGRMQPQIVKDDSLYQMEVSILVNRRMKKCGILHYTTNTETSLESGLMEILRNFRKVRSYDYI